MQRLRESLTILLLGLLPFHAFLVTTGTNVIAGSGNAPLTMLALWKEALLGVILVLATLEIFDELIKRKTENEKRKTETGKRKTENGFPRKKENGKRDSDNGKRKMENGLPRNTEHGTRKTDSHGKRNPEHGSRTT